MKKHLPGIVIAFLRWMKNGPVKGFYALTLLVCPPLGTFRRLVMHYWRLGLWIKPNPFKNFVAIDVGTFQNQERFRRDFLIGLLNLINRPERIKNPQHISVLLSSSHMAAISDIQAMASTIPRNNLGDLEFYFSLEDMLQYHRDSVNERWPLEDFDPQKIDFGQIDRFSEMQRRLVAPAVYDNWARYYLKSLGAERLVYFCDLTSSFEEFFSHTENFSEKCIFLVRTKEPVEMKTQYRFPNVLYLNRSGIGTPEYMAIAGICDGYIGNFDMYSIFALQRSIPTILLDGPNSVSTAEALRIFTQTIEGNKVQKVVSEKSSQKSEAIFTS